MSERITIEDYKEAWREMALREARMARITHAAIYAAVNAFLVFVNLYAGPSYYWFPWVIAGWGMGLAFHLFFGRGSQVLADLRKREALAELIAREKKRS